MPIVVKKARKLGGRPAFGPSSRETSSLRPEFVEKAAPCLSGCPNGTDVRGLMTTLALGESRGLSKERVVEEAFQLLAERNPLPATTGRLCAHHCEDGCHRAGYDEALAVSAVERAVGEAAIGMGLSLKRLLPGPRAERVAVIGSGPAGLSAAYQMARLGYPVVVFDPRPAPGGELRAAVGADGPSLEILDAEIRRIAALGVDFQCGTAEPGDGFDRVIRTKVEGTGDPAAGLAAAVHFGRYAAQLSDAEVRGVTIERLAAPPRATLERIRLDHHPKAPRVQAAASGLTTDEAIAEARRCLACGGCLECDNCWKYCPDQAVIRPLERGQPYRFRLEFCQGCRKCAEECPTGYIEMR
jgi:Pyruvate/2-oxoacid:ferredoxin oxidoreductase delta subunit